MLDDIAKNYPGVQVCSFDMNENIYGIQFDRFHRITVNAYWLSILVVSLVLLHPERRTRSENKSEEIGEILEDKGYVTAEQIGQALAYQKEHRDKRVGQILMELGFVTENQVLEALADRLRLEIVDVAQIPVDLKAVGMINRELAEKNLILPISVKEHSMVLVTNDPLNYFALEEVRQQTVATLKFNSVRKHH